MTETRTDADRGDDLFRRIAAEISHSAPEPHDWAVVSDGHGVRDLRTPRPRRRALTLAVAAVVLVGVGATIAVAVRDDPTTELPPADTVPSVDVSADPWTWSPTIEQPALTDDIDAIPTSDDPAEWADRALFPTATPDGFTIESVSRQSGGDITESGAIDTGDVIVAFLTTSPTGTGDPRIVIETVPAGIGDVDSDVDPVTITTGVGLDWEVLIEPAANGRYAAQAYARAAGPGGWVSLSGASSEEDARSQIEALLTSLRLVAIDEIPTEVVDLADLPGVATTGPGDSRAGFMRAARTTNAWCIASALDNTGLEGCDVRWLASTAPAIFVEFGHGDGIVGLTGLASVDVARIEIDLTDGSTVTVSPTRVDDTGFWLVALRHDGPIPADGPVVATRVFNDAGTLLGEVAGP